MAYAVAADHLLGNNLRPLQGLLEEIHNRLEAAATKVLQHDLEWDEKQPEAAQKEGDWPSNKDEEERPEDYLSYFRLASGCACTKDARSGHRVPTIC